VEQTKSKAGNKSNGGDHRQKQTPILLVDSFLIGFKSIILHWTFYWTQNIMGSSPLHQL